MSTNATHLTRPGFLSSVSGGMMGGSLLSLLEREAAAAAPGFARHAARLAEHVQAAHVRAEAAEQRRARRVALEAAERARTQAAQQQRSARAAARGAAKGRRRAPTILL